MGVKFVILWQRGESVDFGGPSMMAGAIYEAVCQGSSCLPGRHLVAYLG